MPKKYRVELNELDLSQLLDGLEARAEAWEKTANFHRTGESPADFIVEECTDAEEADKIAAYYRSIIAKIQKQRSAGTAPVLRSDSAADGQRRRRFPVRRELPDVLLHPKAVSRFACHRSPKSLLRLCSFAAIESVFIGVHLPAFASLRRGWRWLRKNG